MNSKVIITVLSSAVVVAGALLLMKPSTPKPAKPVESLPVSAQSGEAETVIAPPVAVPTGSLATLSADVQGFFVLNRANVDRAVARWQSSADRLTSTAVWKKLDLGAQLQQQFEQGFRQGLEKNPGAPSPEMVREQFGVFLQKWRGLDEALFAVSSKSTAVKIGENSVDVPGVIAQLAFNKPESAKEAFDVVVRDVLQGQDKVESPNATFTKKGEGEIELLLRGGPSPEKNFPGRIQLDGSTVRLVLGGAPADFFTADPARLLVATPEWSNAATLSPNDSALFGFFNIGSLITTADKIFSSLPPGDGTSGETIKEMRSTLQFYRGIERVWFGMNMNDGARVVSCVTTTPGGHYDELYKKFFANRSAAFGSITQAPTLMDGQTILALGLSVSTATGSLDTIIEQLRTAIPNADAEDSKRIADFLGTVNRVKERLALREIGAFVAPPLMPPIVGAAVLLGGSKLTGEALLKEVAASMNEIARSGQLAAGNPEPADEIATVTAEAGSAPELKINAGGLVLTGSVAKDDSVIISIDSSIVNAMAKRLEKGENYFNSFKQRPELGKLLGESDYFFYLNTSTFIELSRSYLPLLLAQQPQEPKVDQREAEELLDLLKFAYLSFQRSYQTAGKAVCSESTAYVLN